MQKVILYYKFTPVADPETTVAWQRTLCETHALRGRIIVSEQGINGTLGGELGGVKAYIRAMNLHSRFKDIEYKWSEGRKDAFPKLSVKARDELVTLAPDEPFDPFDRGEALRPAEWHELLAKNPDITLLDARNEYESDIGRFKGAITPPIRTFKEIKETVAQLDPEQPVATYCTGDIRCEYLSAYMKHKGFKHVFHLDGGIVKYGQEFKNDGFWEGKCYVFDRRMNLEFAPESADVGRCIYCEGATSDQANCGGAGCLRQVVVCEDCRTARETILCVECN